ncbi:MAG TPA: zinc-ribbon domain-containing protein [Thermodesulfovibrionales bacterium]|nr:zinc-ribbon domain-containing protein [Thermodesulfovibrionales bacterium]
MVVICPKCKIKLKVDDTKLSEGGSRFKCPKCGAMLLVKKPVVSAQKPVDNGTVLVAHSNPSALSQIVTLLNGNGYRTITATEGIEAMVKAIKELPFLMILEVGLPKIFGFEVCKRLKLRPETKGMKFILVNSVYDDRRYRRQPESLYEADDYIEEHRLPELLIDSINRIKGIEPGAHTEKTEKAERPVQEEQPAERTKPAPRDDVKPESKPDVKPVDPGFDEKVERARRLARTIVSDIYLYNTPKVEAAIMNDTFYAVFASELKEGFKLYEHRIAQEVRDKGDFFKETVQAFIDSKKKSL